MKKLILSATAIAGLAMAGSAQQVLFNDNGPLSYDTTIGGVANQTQNLNLELLVGSSSSSVSTPVVTLLLSQLTSTATTALGSVQPGAGDITQAGGTITDTTLNAYLAPGGTAFYEVEAWTGQYSSYAAAEAANTVGVFAGVSAVTAFSPAPASGLPPVGIGNITAFNLAQVPTSVVPEPSTLAMAGVGLVSMLIMRRKIS